MAAEARRIQASVKKGLTAAGAGRRLYASAIGSAPVTPIVAALLTVVQQDGTGTPDVVVVGLLDLVVVWAGLSVAHYLLGLSGPARANATSHALLNIRLDELGAVGGHSRHGDEIEAARTAAAQFRGHRAFVEERIDADGPQWVLGHGYLELWRRVHRAEEEWVQFGPRPDVLAYADRGLRSITGSRMDRDIRETAGKDLEADMQVLRQAASSAHEQSPPEQAARARIKESWRQIHDFRDDRWDGFLGARNRLLLTAAVTGAALYAVLLLAIVGGAGVASIRQATTVFLIGAGVGLLSRLTAQAKTSAVSDDYGLATARLVVTPSLSGTAAVIGIAVVAAAAVGTRNLDLATMFALSGANLLLAAGFGLTPGLVLEWVRKDHERVANEIRSSLPSEGKEAAAEE